MTTTGPSTASGSTAPLVSVMLPTFNQVDFIEEAVRSAVEQDYPRLQVVVADDGSTDGTDEKVRELARRFPARVTPIVGEGRVGMLANFNRTLARCTGELIAFHAGDDVFLPGKIRRQVDWFLEDPRRVLCGHDVEAFDSATGQTLYRMAAITPLRRGVGARDYIERGSIFGGVSLMVRASALPPWRYDPRLVYAAEWLMWIECLAAGGHYGYVDGVLARYRRHPMNITRQHDDVRRDDLYVTLALVEARYPALVGSVRRGRAMLHRSEAVRALRGGDGRTARALFAAALRQRLTVIDSLGLMAACVPRAGALLDRVRPRVRS